MIPPCGSHWWLTETDGIAASDDWYSKYLEDCNDAGFSWSARWMPGFPSKASGEATELTSTYQQECRPHQNVCDSLSAFGAINEDICNIYPLGVSKRVQTGLLCSCRHLEVVICLLKSCVEVWDV